MKLHLLLSVSLVLAALGSASGCAFCSHDSKDVTVVETGAFVHAAGSDSTVQISVTLLGLDGDGHASLGTLASRGDLTLTRSTADVPLGGIIFLSANELGDALVATQTDLRNVAGGTVLVGKTFELSCAANPLGCIAYDAWDGANAHATATVVPAVSSPAPIFTLQLDGTVTTATGAVIPFKGTLPFQIGERSYITGSHGDCS